MYSYTNMKEKLIEKNIHLFSNKKNAKILAVFSHSLSDNHKSDFAEKITEKLYTADISVALYDFSFTRNKTKPSIDLNQEVNDLSTTVSLVDRRIKPKKIILIGKSLGGVVSAIYCSKNILPAISSVFIISFPFKLGFPPDFKLLKKEDPILPDYINQYKNLFKSIKIPTFVVQGDSDDLGEVNECKKFFSKYNNCTLNVIKDSNHSLVSPKNKDITHYDECAELILNKIYSYENRQK